MNEKFGSCIECGGILRHRYIQQVFTRKGRLIAVISDIPAGVCEQCGAQCYMVTVAKKIESQLAEMNRSARKVQVPYARYAA